MQNSSSQSKMPGRSHEKLVGPWVQFKTLSLLLDPPKPKDRQEQSDKVGASLAAIKAMPRSTSGRFAMTCGSLRALGHLQGMKVPRQQGSVRSVSLGRSPQQPTAGARRRWRVNTGQSLGLGLGPRPQGSCSTSTSPPRLRSLRRPPPSSAPAAGGFGCAVNTPALPRPWKAARRPAGAPSACAPSRGCAARATRHLPLFLSRSQGCWRDRSPASAGRKSPEPDPQEPRAGSSAARRPAVPGRLLL